MDESKKLELLETISGESDGDALSAYLTLAEGKVIAQLYPYGGGTEIPPKYDMVVIEIANYLLSKRGGEFETRHTENGVDRTWGSADVPPEIMRKIVPFAGVM